MSERIIVLSEETTNKIAAGEVVERPGSIVKELMENSVDAGATDIRVELEKGGCESITVIDNGSGIEYEDVALVFERHATSKINHFDDIYRISSFGFRGEAMPSIASIARVELQTRRKDDLAGTKALVEHGVISEIAPAGSPVGTHIRVTKIFENVPARRKFLKTEATEQSLCMDAVVRLALAHPEIHFHVQANGRNILVVPKAMDIPERISLIMGADFSDHCAAVNAGKEEFSLSGLISRPDFTRSNSKNIFLFVNRRFVRDNSVTHAILSAYRQVIEARRYPAAVLFLEVPSADVDVNVHPAKMEVRFKNARGVHEFISSTVALALSAGEAAKGSFAYRLTPREKMTTPAFRPGESKQFPLPRGLYSRQNLQQAIDRDLLSRRVEEENKYTQNPERESADFANLQYLGQFAATYVIFAREDELILIDQHAAHERIILEKLKKSSGRENIRQSLLLPEIVTLTPGQVGLLSGHIDFLQDLGLDIEIFGRDAVAVKALPAILPQIQSREIIADIIDQLADETTKPDLNARKEKILAALACRAAIKANSVLTREEVLALYSDLRATPYNSTCPHGRPISVNFSLPELERMFKRK